MRCDELMKTDISCCTQNDSVLDAARKMNEANVGFLPICEANHEGGHQVLGVLTDRDIVMRVVAFQGGRDPRNVKCGEIMSRNPIFCGPSDDIDRAAELMADNQISRMCVVEDDRLLGVISLSDIVQAQEPTGAETLRRVTLREAPALH
jgi:CBS domain-containing protein